MNLGFFSDGSWSNYIRSLILKMSVWSLYLKFLSGYTNTIATLQKSHISFLNCLFLHVLWNTSIKVLQNLQRWK